MAAQIETRFGGAGTTQFFSRWVYNGVGAGAALACFCAARRDRERLTWVLVGCAIASWTAGNVYYAFVSANLQVVPSPSWADAGFLGFYPFAYAAVGLLVRQQVTAFARSMWLDGVIAGLTVSAVAVAVVFDTVSEKASGGLAPIATNLAYPICDALLIAIVVGVLALRSWRLDLGWLLLGLGFGVFAVSDSVYLVRIAGGSYVYGSWLDLGWLFGFVLLATAASRARVPTTRVAFEGRRVLVLPTAFSLALIGVVVANGFLHVSLFAQALGWVALLLLVARMTLAVDEHLSLVATFRQRSLTDPLTSLPNRRAMLERLESVLASRKTPHLVMLFDLNGFKAYNDTFGHLAGDALLKRLGDRLARAIAGRGYAYRLGGDEFCVIAAGGHADIEWLKAATTSALHESGEAFTVGCAFGHAELPAEATTPDQALGLADQRMYDNKPLKAAVSDPRAVLLQAVRERDYLLGDHNGNVANLAARTASTIGLSDAEIATVRDAAALHDVGKLAIPDAILNKPTALDDSEWELIRSHTVIGQRIVCASPGLEDIGAAVRSSHERWDGAGYPDGLVGEQIPLAARIIAITDAYEAMTAGRPYRPAIPHDHAIEELRRCAGSQFDPKLVQAFIDTLTHPIVKLAASTANAS